MMKKKYIYRRLWILRPILAQVYKQEVGCKWNLAIVYDDCSLSSCRDKVIFGNYACLFYENYGREISACGSSIIRSGIKKRYQVLHVMCIRVSWLTPPALVSLGLCALLSVSGLAHTSIVVVLFDLYVLPTLIYSLTGAG